MRTLFSALILIALLPAAAASEPMRPRAVSGIQDGQWPAGEYRSDSVTVIPRDRELALAPGVIMRFQRYSGLRVDGKLICRGTPDNPVMFIALSDTGGPGRWKGIAVSDSGEIDFDYVKVGNSVLSITLNRGSRAIIGHTIFVDNVHNELAVGDSAIAFPYGIAGFWRYGYPGQTKNNPILPLRNGPAEKSPLLLPLQVGLGSIALAGGVLWLFFDRRMAESQKSLDASITTETADKYQANRNNARTGRTAGAVSCIAGAAFYGASITIPLLPTRKQPKP